MRTDLATNDDYCYSLTCFLLKDWDKFANEIRLREGLIRQEIDIEDLALVEEPHAQSHTGNGYGATETHNGEDNFFDAVSD
jgi:hypothetical protein